jgi:hypothetical protein
MNVPGLLQCEANTSTTKLIPLDTPPILHTYYHNPNLHMASLPRATTIRPRARLRKRPVRHPLGLELFCRHRPVLLDLHARLTIGSLQVLLRDPRARRPLPSQCLAAPPALTSATRPTTRSRHARGGVHAQRVTLPGEQAHKGYTDLGPRRRRRRCDRLASSSGSSPVADRAHPGSRPALRRGTEGVVTKSAPAARTLDPTSSAIPSYHRRRRRWKRTRWSRKCRYDSIARQRRMFLHLRGWQVLLALLAVPIRRRDCGRR